jgi:hypothetical protein
VTRLKIVKPQKASAVEQLLVQQAASGQLRERISDDAMVRLLDQVGGEAQGHRPTITVGAGIMWGSGVAVWLCGCCLAGCVAV